jgi:hypothetical protein
MFERPILIYSDFCVHSKNFIAKLIKHSELYEKFIRLNIDVEPDTKQRPPVFYAIQEALKYNITEVPTIIVAEGKYILPGAEAFKWLEYETDTTQQAELSGFNPIEMGSFSDIYSPYGSNEMNNATEQCFKFINKEDERINTPQEDNTTAPQDYSTKQMEREAMDKSIYNPTGKNTLANPESIEYNRNVNTRNNIDFSKISVSKNKNGFTDKQVEIDKRLQQLLLDRQAC